MSSEFERFLREARQTLPEPDDAATRRGRERALLAMVPRRRRFRPVAFVVALVLAIGLGVGIGAFVVPSGTAAESPVGFGFLPERDWYVLQSGVAATPERPAVAFASNVPLSPDDGRSIVPYSTLQRLPPEGIVIVANFTGRADYQVIYPSTASFPPEKLPLRIRDATPYIQWGGQVRPEQPLGQYQLKADIDGYAVDIYFYFGTPQASEEQMDAAQRQLDRLVVQPSPDDARKGAAVASGQATPGHSLEKVVDRTFDCRTTLTTGPLRDLDVTSAPQDANPYTKIPAHLRVGSGRSSMTSDLVAVRTESWQGFGNNRFAAGVYAHASRCGSARTLLRLSPTGLPAPPVVWGKAVQCQVRGRVLVRVRAMFRSPATWRRADDVYVGARGRVLEAKIAVTDESTRKPLAFMEVDASGATRFWRASRCA